MVKKFKIMVDGVSHIVEVEELGKSNTTINNVTEVKTQEVKSVNTEQKEVKQVVSSANSITAPLQGTIQDIKVTEGQSVKTGDVVLIIEAMKMENEVVSPKDGVIGTIHITKGQRVNSGDPLFELN